MKKQIDVAKSRGGADHGWLRANHTFSFAGYHNPERMGFGVLRVINDDHIAPTRGFETHPHQDMEIVTIPISGALKHKDSMGNEAIIKEGEVQVMSAGTGILHSEFNPQNSEWSNILQTWVLPKKRGIKPRYEQKEFSQEERQNKIQLLVSPNGINGSLSINQDVYYSQVQLEEGRQIKYDLKDVKNGAYLFLIAGEAKVAGSRLESRDGVGVWETDTIELEAVKNSNILIIEGPMEVTNE